MSQTMQIGRTEDLETRIKRRNEKILKSTSDLGGRFSYLTPRKMIIGGDIVEYDIKSSNTSIAREYNLLPASMCDELEALPKMEREITVGNIKKNDPEYSKKEKEGLIAAKKAFIEANGLDVDNIIAIKGDAFFINNAAINNEWVGEYIHFRKKGQYESFLYFDPVEIYHDRENRKLVVKQISDETYEILHSNYFGKFIEQILNDMESGVPVRTRLVHFFDKYKNRELDLEYYREFNAQSLFRYLNGEVTSETYQDLDDIDISYNLKLLADLMFDIITMEIE